MQALTKKNVTRASLKRRSTPRTVLLRMAEDAERAQRLKDIKAERPRLHWGDVADAAGVKERTVLGWAKTGAMSYEHAEAIAAFLNVDLDWFWHGPKQQSPDLMSVLGQPDRGDQLDDIQRKLDRLLSRLLPATEEEAEETFQQELEAADEQDGQQAPGSGRGDDESEEKGPPRPRPPR